MTGSLNSGSRPPADAMNAVEAFVNLAMIAAGLLQLPTIEHAENIQRRHCCR